MIDLWTTVVGSHVWNMNHEKSDLDLFNVYVAPSKDILIGNTKSGKSSHIIDQNVDIASHEVGKVVQQLIKGNVNYIIGVMSPLETYSTGVYHVDLQQIVTESGLTKACVPSIRGLAISNYKKYILSSTPLTEQEITKKCNTINRTLQFGINILEGNGCKFYKITDQTPNDVIKMLHRFDEVVANSKLPEQLNPLPFHEYLLKIRMAELDGTL